MNLQFKGLGAEPKKMAALALLVVVLGVVFYINVLAPSGDRPPTAARAAVQTPTPDLAPGTLRPPAAETRPRPPLRPGPASARPEFKLDLRDKQPDSASIDPTLRIDLLAKVQAVANTAGSRNLFQFGTAPVQLPKVPEPKILPRGFSPSGTSSAVGLAAAPTPVPKPPPPPITLKFYGYAAPAPSGARRVFFLDGDEIIVATEGETVKKRYKVVRVGINSVTVEDTQFQHEQTLPLEVQPG
jgi:hypothetical protein